MNKQQKDVIGMMIIVIPIFALLFIGWHFTPMYKDIKAAQWQSQRIALQRYLMQTYYEPWSAERQEIINIYGFNEHEINPALYLDNMTRQNQILGGFK